ncbi:ISBmu22 transposase [Paraburkholderia hospita]|uniref:ISBmu22 transposase n=1 Tax=Paraburkholderia hospita TaxID=169430 RepID=A0ABN0F9H8_9BURK|nr:ISBmu22 transposase [Paraburkholderia hospita]
MNNRAENSHQLTFLSSFGPLRQHFALKRHLLGAWLYHKQLAARYVASSHVTELTQATSAF